MYWVAAHKALLFSVFITAANMYHRAITQTNMPQQYIIGCSGFHYKDWRGQFYPEDLPQSQWLEFYARTFGTVEINNSFYRMPKENAVKGWYAQAPAGFRFTLKGHRYTTHMKKLKDPQESVKRFYHMADGLKEKLGCVLWQLPKNLHKDTERLEHFCTTLKPEYQNVIEFRHNSWWHTAVYDILQRHQTAFCILSAPDNLPDALVETADFAYVRFHGTKEWYNYLYSANEMKEWANKIKTLKAKKVYIYFNNDMHANAIKNGEQLQRLLTNS